MSVCKPCGHTFAHSSSLRAHARKFHPGIVQDIAPKKQYNIAATCKECSKTFSLYCNFKKHVRKYHGGIVQDSVQDIAPKKQYNIAATCKECSKTFSLYCNFKKHVRKFHSGIVQDSVQDIAPKKQYNIAATCKECSKTFSLYCNFKKHVRKFHSGIVQDSVQDIAPKKQYNIAATCKECSKTFSLYCNFKKHVRKFHSGIVQDSVQDIAPKKQYNIAATCKECSKTFSLYCNFKKHVRKFHSGIVQDSVQDIAPKKQYNIAATCKECSKTFSLYCNFKKHVRKFHSEQAAKLVNKPKGNPSSASKFKCKKCEKIFFNFGELKTHKKVCCNIIDSVQHQSKKKCPLCTYTNSSKVNLIHHFELRHDIQISSKNLTFSTFEEFTAWKNELEKTTRAKFVKNVVIRFNVNKSKRFIFECHRSGIYRPRGKGLRHLKSQGTCKINGFCPAKIKVIELENGECKVVWNTTHVGHDHDLGHITLTSNERMQIAAKIAAKTPFSEILDDIRDSVSNGELDRLHLLTRDDLYNIESSFNLNSHSVRHKNDALSVEAWINEMVNSGCVLFYKGQDQISEKYPYLTRDDFVLIITTDGQVEILKKYGADCICIDSTHGVNAYDFQLTTLLVLDDILEGFPCSYLISNRTDEPTISIFFSEVKERLGEALGPKVFMSDMAPTFYNAWKKVMYPASYSLFCAWHIDRAWKQNINKIKTKEEQAMVYKQLRTLLQERDQNVFVSLINNFIISLLSKESTIEFGKYFKAQYLNNSESWAYCYYINTGLNTNMHIERMHRTIKYLYLGKKHAKPLDKAINAIMKFTKDKLFERLIVLNKEGISSKIKNIRLRHKNSDTLDLNTIVQLETGWQVPSSSSTEIYIVEERNLHCDCKIFCHDCEVCLHRYSCTCLDATIRWNMCKHIHLVCKFRTVKKEPSANILTGVIEDNVTSNIFIDESKNEEKEEELVITRTVNRNRRQVDSEEKVKKEIESLNLTVMQATAGIVSMEECEAVKKMIKTMVNSIEPTLIGIRNQSNNENKLLPSKITSSNKNIAPQRRLKKQNSSKINKELSFAMPISTEMDGLALNLLHPDVVADSNISHFEEVEESNPLDTFLFFPTKNT